MKEIKFQARQAIEDLGQSTDSWPNIPCPQTWVNDYSASLETTRGQSVDTSSRRGFLDGNIATNQKLPKFLMMLAERSAPIGDRTISLVRVQSIRP